MLTRFGHFLYGVYVWCAFVPVALLAVLVVCVTPGRDRCRRVVRGAAALLLALTGLRPRVRGLEHLPRSHCVLVANHASYLDGIILTAVLPPRFGFVIKREMMRVPIAHFLLRRIGSEFVERFDRHRGGMDARRILRRTHLKESLVFFPEGTFRHEPGLRAFHAGAFAMAVRGRVPAVPVAIRGSRRVLPAERWLPRPGPLSVEVQPPLEPATGVDAVVQLRQATRQSILGALGEPDLEHRPARIA